MKSFALISFVILNLLLVNFVSAMGSINEEIQSHAIQAHQIQIDVYATENIDNDNSDINGLSHIDESKCDHMCHIASHMMGFISLFTEQPIIDTSITLSVVTESFLSLILDPPFQPPQALI